MLPKCQEETGNRENPQIASQISQIFAPFRKNSNGTVSIDIDLDGFFFFLPLAKRLFNSKSLRHDCISLSVIFVTERGDNKTWCFSCARANFFSFCGIFAVFVFEFKIQ